LGDLFYFGFTFSGSGLGSLGSLEHLLFGFKWRFWEPLGALEDTLVIATGKPCLRSSIDPIRRLLYTAYATANKVNKR
jgi:hypothetical protein